MIKNLWHRHPARVILLTVALLLVALRVALPTILKAYVNHVLDRDPAYDGQVEDIDVALIRGAYTINGIQIVKTTGAVPVPFFAAQAVDLSVKWRALLHGAIVGEIEMQAPRINFVNGATDDQTQAGGGVDWRQQIRDLFPLRIDRLSVDQGEIHYVDFSGKQDVDVFLSDVHLVAENLTNSLQLSETMLATIDMTATAMHDGALKAHAQLDPYTESPTFDLDAQLTHLPLTSVNDLLRRYGHFDVEAGRADVYMELAARDGALRGYVKPMLFDVKVVSLAEDLKEGGPVQTAWEVAVRAAEGLMQNDKQGDVAARVPIEGSMSGPDVHPWPVLFSALRHAFVTALFHGLDGDINMADAPHPNSRDVRATAREERRTEADGRKLTRDKAKARRAAKHAAAAAGGR